MALLFAGDLGAASSLVEEAADGHAGQGKPSGALQCDVPRRPPARAVGDDDRAPDRVDHIRRGAVAKGEGISIAVAKWTRAVLHNGQGRYADATTAAREALHHQEYPRAALPGHRQLGGGPSSSRRLQSQLGDRAPRPPSVRG